MLRRRTAAMVNQLRMVWLGLCSSIIVFGVVLVVLEREPSPDSELLPLVFAGVAVGVAVAVFVVRRVFFGPSLGLLPVRDPPSSDRLSLDEAKRALSAHLQRGQVGSIIGFALSEAVALFGFVSSFLTGEIAWFLGHAVFALLLMLVQFPRIGGILGGFDPEARRLLDEA